MNWTFLRTRRVARYYFKVFVNWLISPIREKPLFEITMIERMQASGTVGFPNSYIARVATARRWLFSDTFLGPSLLILILLGLVALLGHWLVEPVTRSKLLDANLGLIFDIIFIVLLIGFFQHRLERKRGIAAQREIIEDMKRWDSEASMHRVVGALRRLNNMEVTDVDLTGAALTNAKLKGYGVTSLRGSKLSGGGWADETMRESSFKNVDFSRLDLRDAVFGHDALGFGFARSGRYEDCNFWDAKLRGSSFDAAELHWTTPPPDSLYEVNEYEEGNFQADRVHADSFNDCDLAHVSFKNCRFHWADFRVADNIETADFSGATGLETCAFDSEELKALIITRAKGDAK